MTNARKILTFRENLTPLLHFLADREIWVFILCSSWYLAITESSYADNLSRRIGRRDLQDLNSDDLVITLSNLPRTQCLFNWIQIRWEGTIFAFLTS